MPTLTDKQIEESINSPDNLINRLEIHKIPINRENPNIPPEIRKTICILANEDDVTNKELAEQFDLAPSQVSMAKHGKNSSNQPCEALVPVMEEIKTKRVTAEGRAIDALISTIDTLQPQLQRMTKPHKLSAIARDLANVAEKISGGSSRKDIDNPFEGKGIHLHLHVPKQKKIEDYDIIDAN
jgi:hypothetical protein